MNITGSAMQAAVLKVLLDEISDRLSAAKKQAMEAFTESGAVQAIPELPDGTPIAAVSLAGSGRNTAYVSEENELMAWVLRQHPDQVELVIRGSYQRALLDAAKEAGRPVDPVTGEVVPGITVKGSHGYISVRFKQGAREAVAEAWRSGQLTDVEIVSPAPEVAAEPVTDEPPRDDEWPGDEQAPAPSHPPVTTVHLPGDSPASENTTPASTATERKTSDG